ncbi:MAG: hypothetical protein EOP46_07215, partial [Sphingobacteriaceae bacterium]
MSAAQKAAVVIPFYKTKLTPFEEIALKQCFTVLSAHPIIAVKPLSLELPTQLAAFAFSKKISFNDSYFKDIHGYNALMLSADFYNTFTDFEYILIYQPDAFVFNDELTAWCNKGYDYIGAPWLTEREPGIFRKIKNQLYFSYNAKYKNGMPKIGRQMENRVGNGGFSLRKIETFARYAATYKQTIESYLGKRHPWFNEDIFWSIELNRKKNQMRIPDYKTALKFSFETNPARCLSLNNGK